MTLDNKQNFQPFIKIIIALIAVIFLIFSIATDDNSSGNNAMSVDVPLFASLAMACVGSIFLFLQAVHYVTKKNYRFALYNTIIILSYFTVFIAVLAIKNS